MNDKQRLYRKLPGRRQGVVVGARLWLADDHILSVESWRLREEYRRFYFRDIHSISVVKKAAFVMPSWLAGLLLGLLPPLVLLPFIPGGASTVLAVLCGLAVVPALGWLIVSVTAGCRVTLTTAVSTVRLKSLYRMRPARKFLAIVEPRIAEAQGVLPDGWLEQEVEAIAPARVEEAAPAPATPAVEPGSWIPALLLPVSLALLGAASWCDLRWPAFSWRVVVALAGTAIGISGTWLLVQRGRRQVTTSMAVSGVVACLVTAVLCWVGQFASAIELGAKQTQSGAPWITHSYRLVETATAVAGIAGAIWTGVLGIVHRTGDNE